MITPMKKYAFLVFHQDYEEFLLKLGKLGVLHVIEKSDGEKEESLYDKESLMERIDATLDILRQAAKDEGEVDPVSPADDTLTKILSEVESLDEQSDILEHEIEELRKEEERIMPWGNYDPDDFKTILRAGYDPYLFKSTIRQFDPEWEKRDNVFVISEHEGHVYFLVLVKTGEEPDINAEQEKPVDRSLETVQDLLRTRERELKETQVQLAGLARTVPERLKDSIRHLESEISLLNVYMETRKASGDTLRILEGWVPASKEKNLEELVEKEDIVSFATEPEKGEVPPVELKNRKFPKLFEPISKLFDLPSYGELDLTPYFAPFFMMFFGFCLGDAGYGVFFIIFAAILKRKAKAELKPILSLTQYLGIATIFFGLLSGTFFGINLIDSGYTITAESIEKLKDTEVPATVVSQIESIQGTYYESRSEFLAAVQSEIGEETLADYEKEVLKNATAGIPLVGKFRHLMQDSLSMFYLAILIGGLQILFGIFVRILNITRQKGFKYAISTLGWLVLIITLILYYAGIFGGQVLTWFFYGMLGISGIMIFFLNNPDSNIFARFGAGIWDSYGMVTGLFGDLLSYIRLFALGISSAILGFVFNDISLQLLNIPYIGWLFFLLLLIAGHSINLFLASLGGFIHPMRLTFVEFYKNAGFQGGGKKYKPFVINN